MRAYVAFFACVCSALLSLSLFLSLSLSTSLSSFSLSLSLSLSFYLSLSLSFYLSLSSPSPLSPLFDSLTLSLFLFAYASLSRLSFFLFLLNDHVITIVIYITSYWEVVWRCRRVFSNSPPFSSLLSLLFSSLSVLQLTHLVLVLLFSCSLLPFLVLRHLPLRRPMLSDKLGLSVTRCVCAWCDGPDPCVFFCLFYQKVFQLVNHFPFGFSSWVWLKGIMKKGTEREEREREERREKVKREGEERRRRERERTRG